ncbi:MAG: AmiS/UreI family transporter [Dehalococcoidales bacterium]|nr:AmiS/UreI family transporter [Dehalococcoidales bacterium]
MLGLGLWYVGFVLFINALWMMGKMSNKAVIPMNIFVAVIQIAGVFVIIATGKETADFYGAALTLLFAFTYLYVAATQIWNLDGKGLGWYCLPVALIAIPAGFQSLATPGLALLWFMWATLWFMFFLLLGLGKNIGKATAYWTMINAIVTFVGAYFTLTETWPWW